VLLMIALAFVTGCDRREVEAWLEQPPPAKASPLLYDKSTFANVKRALFQKAGGDSVAALSLLVYPDHAVLQSQNLHSPKTVDQYVYRGGQVAGPVAVKLLGKGKLEDNLFPLQAVRLDNLPDLVRAAQAKVDMPEGKVTRVLLRRNLPESMDIQFRVFVTSQRRDAIVNADKDGNIIN
jgi:hypothetical protein